MDSPPPFKPTFIRDWRKFRGMSLGVLADEAGIDKGNLSKLERGEHPYKQDVLNRIAKALGTTAEVIVSRGPEAPTPIVDYLVRASPTVRRQIEDAAAAIFKASGEQ